MSDGDDEPHYLGHRKRLRKKFRESGKEAFHDYELLELLLTYAIPRGDVKPIAKNLIDEFDSLSGVLEADYQKLKNIEGIGNVSATFFPLLKEIKTEYFAEKMEGKEVLSGPEAVADFTRFQIGDEEREVFLAIYVNKQNQALDHEILQKGTIDEANLRPREVVKSALNANAKGIILVHNHPSGSLEPSKADEQITGKLNHALASVEIELLDHLIVTKSNYRSIFSFN